MLKDYGYPTFDEIAFMTVKPQCPEVEQEVKITA